MLLILLVILSSANLSAAADRPNIIYLMLDEWGYFESGHMGHRELVTPNIDQFAGEGMRFTNAYAGAPVCGPTRCVLLTGQHSGHSSMRVNDGFSPIRADEPTLGSMLKQAGYATGGFGKWGIGGRGTSGIPEQHGFDEFFGYYDQVHAHTYYPQYLIRNSREVPLPGNPGDSFFEGETHAQQKIFEESLAFIRQNSDQPFFCYLPWTPPHGLWGIDEDDPSWQLFKDKPWTAGQRTDRDARVYAAFMHMVDRQIGGILELLQELQIDENTVFFLSGDNGGQAYFKTDDRPHGFFGPNLNPKTGERFRAGKGSLYEGGLKVPYLVRWPDRIAAGSVSDHVLSFQDVMPTLADLSKTSSPPTDGLSFAPTLLGQPEQKKHAQLYWEFGNQTAVRMQHWKAYRQGQGDWELYDLSTDIEEQHNVAADHPAILQQMVEYARQAHEPVRPGKVFDRSIIEKDRRQAPHQRRPKRNKQPRTASRPSDQPSGSRPNTRPPNFVVIFTDDQGWQDAGCFGSPDIRTPRLDKMAQQGMKFTSFYAQPICGPSRAALMTGCYPMRVAERGHTKQIHPVLHEDEITVAEILKDKGYATACFGKWDLAKHAQTGFYPDLFPTHQGFDYFFGTPTSNDRIVNLYRNDKLIEPKAEMSNLTERYTDEAIAFIERNQEQPFFVYLPHSMPHTRLDASARFKGKSPRGLYGDVIEEIDFNVGRIIDRLQQLKLTDNTYVLFTSDNGPWLIKNRNHADGHRPDDHGGSAGPLRSGKVSTFEGGVRVPAILWGPGRVPAGTTCRSIATTMDVLPTFAALADAEVPSDRIIDGQDITHLFHGQFEQADPDRTYFYYLRVHLQAVRQGKWKLHLPREQEPVGAAPFSRNNHIAPADRIGFARPFLVDLQQDLGETTDVSAQHPKVVQRLLALAETMREDLGDYDRVGKNMRFFDPLDERPTRPPVPPPRQRQHRPAKSPGQKK